MAFLATCVVQYIDATAVFDGELDILAVGNFGPHAVLRGMVSVPLYACGYVLFFFPHHLLCSGAFSYVLACGGDLHCIL